MPGKVLFTQKKAGVALCMVLLVLAQQVSAAPGVSKGLKSVEMCSYETKQFQFPLVSSNHSSEWHVKYKKKTALAQNDC